MFIKTVLVTTLVIITHLSSVAVADEQSDFIPVPKQIEMAKTIWDKYVTNIPVWNLNLRGPYPYQSILVLNTNLMVQKILQSSGDKLKALPLEQQGQVETLPMGTYLQVKGYFNYEDASTNKKTQFTLVQFAADDKDAWMMQAFTRRKPFAPLYIVQTEILKNNTFHF